MKLRIKQLESGFMKVNTLLQETNVHSIEDLTGSTWKWAGILMRVTCGESWNSKIWNDRWGSDWFHGYAQPSKIAQ